MQAKGSDLNHGSVGGAGGERGEGTCWFLSRLSLVVQAEPVPELEARVLYSLIIFQNYTAITFKIQSWGGFSGWDGGGQGLGADGVRRRRVDGGVGGEWRRDSGKAHLTDLSDKHYKLNSYYYSF